MDIEPELLRVLLEASETGLTVGQLVSRLGVDQSLIMAAAVKLEERGVIEIIERRFSELTPGPQWKEKLPERVALEKLGTSGKEAVELSRLPQILGKDDVRAEVKWLTKKGWFSREHNRLVLTDKGRQALAGAFEPDEQVLKVAKGKITEPELKDRFAGIDIQQAIRTLRGREELVKIRERVERVLKLTPEGKVVAETQAGTTAGPKPEITQLTPELLASGRWREVGFRRYDVTLTAKAIYPGKEHPLQRIIAEARRAFLEMGFKETSSPVVELAFWDFDALFQPQDHPAREMQDTFYLAVPAKGRLPNPELVNRVATAHQNGGDTGSRGWGYHWRTDEAERLLLRTHTTAATIRALAQNPNPPCKVFCIGKVFRRENMDATHLPEFIQIDGIIIDDHASLVTLFGTLVEFYRKMGAQEVRFRPSYFPYTEPSVEVFANLGRLGWVEMGGAGIFRPEVTMPLGCKSRVLAWGLGLERLAMLRFGVNDIRKLYWADINWLREAKLCR